MKKCFVSLLVIAVVGGMVLGAGNLWAEEGGSAAPIKIGLNMELTGLVAESGLAVMRGVEYALEEVGYTVAGRPVKLIREDNGSDVIKAMDKARKLVEVDHVDVMLGPIFTPSAFGVVDYLKESGIPNIHGIQPEDLLRRGQGNLFFTLGVQEYIGTELGRFLYEKGYRSASIVIVDDSAADYLTKGCVEAFQAAGGKVLQKQVVPLGAADYSPYLINMKPVDVILFWNYGPPVITFFTQLKQYGINAQVAIPANAIIIYEETLQQIGDDALGVIGCDFYSPLIDSPANKKFVEGFMKKHGVIPQEDATGYTNAKIFLKAVEEAGGDTSPAALKAALHKVKVDTPMGLMSYAPSGAPIGDMKIQRVIKQNGKYAWAIEKVIPQVMLGPER